MHFSGRNAALIATITMILFANCSYGQFKNPFKRNSEKQRSDRELSIKDGPWLVMCTSFSGDEAEQHARILANELSQHRLKTYIYRQDFDYTGTTTGIGYQTPASISRLSRPGDLRDALPNQSHRPVPLKMKSANLGLVKEVAVLVGDFSSVDDHRAKKALEKVKSLRLQNPVGHLGRTIDPELARAQNLSIPAGGQLRTAILVPNPKLPDDYFQRSKVDDFVVKLNKAKAIKHSLLDCPGMYTVRIASFRGSTTFDPNQISNGQYELQSLKRSGKSLTKSRLLEAEENAHKITLALRKKGIEAYEFHDRTESIVCIGSFDWVTRESGGNVINNPEIVKLVNKLRPEVKNLPGAPGAVIPKSIKGVALDPEPTPILVPKVQKTREAKRFRLLR